jgi:hypothetical protein
MRFCRKASATAWARLRTSSLIWTFFRWLRTDPQCLCHFAVSGPVEIARHQPSRRPYPHEIRVGQLIQAGLQCRLNFPLNGLARIANLFRDHRTASRRTRET